MCAVEIAAVQLLSLWSTLYLQEYMDLGPAFLEHVAGLRMHGGPVAVAKLPSALYFYTDQDYLRDVDPPEMLALLQATSALVRRCEFCAIHHIAATSYALTSALCSYTNQDSICIEGPPVTLALLQATAALVQRYK